MKEISLEPFCEINNVTEYAEVRRASEHAAASIRGGKWRIATGVHRSQATAASQPLEASDIVLAGLQVENRLYQHAQAERNDWFITHACARLSVHNT